MLGFGHWRREDRGELSLKVGESEIRIVPLLEGWYLSGPDFDWVESRLEDLAGVAEFYEGYLRRREHRFELQKTVVSEDLGDEFSLEATLYPGASFQVHIKHKGRIVGRYEGFPNGPLATFVLGEDTIQGAEMLDEFARRRGFGDKMRDAAERITGLSAVPHGRNYTTGSLSDLAERSWSRRAETKKVLGYGTDIGIKVRSNMARLCRQRLSKMRNESCDFPRAMSLSEKTGLPLVIGFSAGLPVSGWVVLKNGLPIDPSGSIDPRQLKENAGTLSLSKDGVKLKQMTFRKAETIVKRDWRSSLSEEDRKYVNDMVEFIGSPKLRKIAETAGLSGDVSAKSHGSDLAVQGLDPRP